MRNPVDARKQCSLVHGRSWRDGKPEDDLRLYSRLSEAHKREPIADFGKVVHRAVVNISPHWCIGPNRAIGETNFAPRRHLPVGLAHLLHCSGYTVRLVETERRKPRRERLDLVSRIEGRERLGSNPMNVDQRIHITVDLDPEDLPGFIMLSGSGAFLLGARIILPK